MALRGYIPKHGKALWTKTPSGAAQLRREAFRKAAKEVRVEKFRKRIASATPQTTARRRQYNARVADWIQEVENKWCRVWLAVSALTGRIEYKKATQCHHRRGRKLTRLGDLLMLESEWVPVSASGHDWIDKNRARARELGLLAPKGEYDTWPK